MYGQRMAKLQGGEWPYCVQTTPYLGIWLGVAYVVHVGERNQSVWAPTLPVLYSLNMVLRQLDFNGESFHL